LLWEGGQYYRKIACPGQGINLPPKAKIMVWKDLPRDNGSNNAKSLAMVVTEQYIWNPSNKGLPRIEKRKRPQWYSSIKPKELKAEI